MADDRVLVWASGGRAWGRAPGSLAGLMEVRHVRIACEPPVRLAEIAVVVDLVPAAADRLAEPRTAPVAGVETPLVELGSRNRDAVLRLPAALALAAIGFDTRPARRI